jgi:hypothetical protein
MPGARQRVQQATGLGVPLRASRSGSVLLRARAFALGPRCAGDFGSLRSPHPPSDLTQLALLARSRIQEPSRDSRNVLLSQMSYGYKNVRHAKPVGSKTPHGLEHASFGGSAARKCCCSLSPLRKAYMSLCFRRGTSRHLSQRHLPRRPDRTALPPAAPRPRGRTLGGQFPEMVESPRESLGRKPAGPTQTARAGLPAPEIGPSGPRRPPSIGCRFRRSRLCLLPCLC